MAWDKVQPDSKVDFYRRLNLDPAQATQRLRRVCEQGGELHYDEAWAMMDALGWIQLERRPLDLAEELVTQLDAGERIPRRELERAAKAVDLVASELPRLADRLRAGAQAARRAR